MRRIELLVDQVRRATETESPGANDNINSMEIVQYMNDAQDNIYAAVVKQHSNVFLKESNISLVADQESYDLPTDIYLGTKIKTVEYKYGSGSNDYYKILPRSFHYRKTDYSSKIPEFYIRKGDDILINPIPSEANTNGLRLIYQRKLRTLDIRRGVIASAAKTGTTLDSITLDTTPTLAKDGGAVQAAIDLLNDADYICVVDKDGASVVDSIPIDSYNSTTGVITPGTFTTSVTAASFANQYVVGGKLATTHSELPDICESYLVLYATLKILERNANSIEMSAKRQELAARQSMIVDMFKTPDDDIYIFPIDEMWRDSEY